MIINLSLPRRRESSKYKRFWIPAFAGMTFLGVANLLSFQVIPPPSMGRDEGEGGTASQVFRVSNQPFRQLSVTLSHALPHQGHKR